MEEPTNKSCQDKAAFRSEEEARAAATTADWQHGRESHVRLKPYLCDHCGLYHLASDYTDDV